MQIYLSRAEILHLICDKFSLNLVFNTNTGKAETPNDEITWEGSDEKK